MEFAGREEPQGAAGQVLEQGANQVTILIVRVMTRDQL